MIPLNVEDPVVLKRTLEEIEATIPKLDDTTRTTTLLDSGADLAAVIAKVNELVGNVNLVITTLNNN